MSLEKAVLASLPALATGFADQPVVEARLRSTLGRTFAYLGDAPAAVEQYERARALYVKWMGPDHPATLVSTGNLANGYEAAGRHPDAVRMREETLATQKRILAADHPDTVMTMNNLANSYFALERDADALKLFEETLAAQKRSLAADHPHALSTMHNLANVYAAMDRHADALKLREETLTARQRVLPPDHPDTLKSMNNLARSYEDLNRFADALKLHEATLAARRRVLPLGHPDTLNSMLGVATVLVELNRGAEAIPVIDECASRAADRVVHPRMVPELMGLRMRHFRQAGDPAGCRATAAVWETFNRTDAISLYTAGRWRAVAAGAYAKTNQPAEATADADRAVAWLTKAVAAGYKDRAHMTKDADLDALRGRADFQALLAGLPDVSPPPKR